MILKEILIDHQKCMTGLEKLIKFFKHYSRIR